MPPRFTEILDVQSEMGLILSSLATRTSGVAVNLTSVASEYVNATAGQFDEKLVSVLASYNLTKSDLVEQLAVFNLTITNHEIFQRIDRPRPIPAYLMGAGSVLLAAHLFMVHFFARRMVQEYGNHGPAGGAASASARNSHHNSCHDAHNRANLLLQAGGVVGG